MNNRKLFFFIFAIVCSCSFCSFLPAQFSYPDSVVNIYKPVSIEKVYIQTDREFYALGDTLWYKAYSVDGLSNKPFDTEHNLSVELVSLSGQVIIHQRHVLLDGYAFGDFQLPDTILAGAYIIRAFTPIQERIGEQAFFHKIIRLEKVMNSFEQQSTYPDQENMELATDISFLPEGGNMVYNVVNIIAFKSVSEHGNGVDIRGRVMDETGNTVVEFSSVYQGMGKFEFVPRVEHEYFVSIDKYPDFSYKFTGIKQDGLILKVDNSDSAIITVSVLQNSEKITDNKVILTAMFRDEFLFYVQVELNSELKVIRLDKSLFPSGIVKLTLFNQHFEPIAERLIFRNNNDSQLPVSISMDKSEYCSRQKAVLSIHTTPDGVDSAYCRMSASVVNTGYVDAKGLSQNILSYLLLDSELKGKNLITAKFFQN